MPSNKLRKKALAEKSELKIDINLINQKKISPVYNGPKYMVIFDNDQLIALSKPVNSHSNSQKYSDENTSTSWMRANNYLAPLLVNHEQLNRGLINRLDFETSGVLIYLKDENEYIKARSDIHSCLLYKEYRAIVEGEFPEYLIMHDKLASKDVKGRKVCISDSGNNATSEASLISYNKESNLSMIKVILKTGLRHQIRVQLSSRGFPIVGDNMYSGRESDRLYLHAYNYKIQIQNQIFEIVDNKLEGSLFNLYSCL